MSEIRKILNYEIVARISDNKSTVTELGLGPEGYVYLKTLKSFQSSPADVARLRNEYETQRRIKHDGRGAGRVMLKEFEGLPVLVVSANAEAVSLESLLGGHALDIREFLKISISIAKALAKIHEAGIVHKDINPQNLMIGRNAEAQIINFEVSSCLEIAYQESRSITTLEGTLAYMSPEQTQRMNRPTDYRTDLYSIGVVFYQMLCGRLPFASEDPMDLIYSHIARQPVPPIDVNSIIPDVVSRMVMKLLSKNAEDRYNSSFGLQRDLEICLDRLTADGLIDSFAIGQHDISRRLQIPQKLYGRTDEKQKLLSIYEDAAKGENQFCLISGYSGIGKTMLVNEIYKPVTARKGFFVFGKYDQFQNKAPYSAISKAMGLLLQGLLSEPPQKIAHWRRELLEAVGHNGEVLIEFIPELKAIIGPQPEVGLLGISESKSRFERTFQNFISVFAKKEHPLAIFLDDLQWVDSASLELLKLMLTKTQYLCLIGSYRDNEMPKTHPLMNLIGELRKGQFRVHEIILKPLRFEDLSHLLSESLRLSENRCSELAQLVLDKTNGNPFFVNEFLRQLSRLDALKLNDEMVWTWDIHEIGKLNVTDNVVDLMSQRVRNLPVRTQNLLKLAACAGNTFDYQTIAAVSAASLAQTIFNLSDAIREGMLVSTGDFSNFENTARGVLSGAIDEQVLAGSLEGYHCRFLHDRIQQACYELTGVYERAELHYRIGKMMLNRSNPKDIDEDIIAIVNHMNCAQDLFESENDRRELSDLNLRAAQRARASAAHEVAASYTDTGLNALGPTAWTIAPQLCLELHILSGECKSLLGRPDEAARMLKAAMDHAPDRLSRGRIYNIRISHLSSQGNYIEAVTCGIEAVKLYGYNLPEIDDREKILSEFMRAYEVYNRAIAANSIEHLFELPVNDSAEHIQVANLLSAMLDCAIIGPSHYLGLVAVTLANLAIENGNTVRAATGYGWLGVVEIAMGRYAEAYALGELSLRLLEERFTDNSRLGSQLDVFATFQSYLKRPSRDSYSFWERAFQESTNAGEQLYAAYSAINGARQSIMWNASTLSSCDEFSYKQLLRIDQLNAPVMSASIRSLLGFIHSLRGMTKGLDSTDYEGYSEDEYRRVYGEAPLLLAMVENFHLMLAYMRGDFARAKDILDKNDFSPIATFVAHSAENKLFGGLTYASLCAEAPEEERADFLEKVRANHGFLSKLSESCPENFGSLERILAAECALLEGEALEKVLNIYEQGIKAARDNGFLNFAAIGFERAARACDQRGQSRIASVYLRESHSMYAKWGATAKAREFEARFPALFPDTGQKKSGSSALNEILTTQGLDLATALNAAQTMSGEIVQERLLVKMMRTLLECGGAQVAILVLEDSSGESVVRVRAEASSTELLNAPLEEYKNMCLGVVRFVQRTQQIVSLDDAARDNRFSPDPYVRKNQTKSVLCLPVQSQGRKLGYLYMENNLAERAFNDDRVALLKMLASQAAISLENSELYANMELRVQSRTQELNQSLENLKAAQAQLANSSKMSALGQMAGGIAHEINTPLAIVQLQAETLKDMIAEKPLNESAVQTGLDIILSTAERVAKVISGLRSFSRDGSRDDFQQTSIRSLFDQTLALCGERFQKNNVAVILEEFSPDLKVSCRATEISQVILNLFNNSFDATEPLPDRWIKVSLQETANEFRISITDSGPGIPERAREKLFEPFFTTKPVGKGTGLGLSISQGILRKHGGDLYLDTSNPNTSFVIQLLKKPAHLAKAS